MLFALDFYALFEGDRARRVVNDNGHTGQWGIRWPLHNGGVIGRVELGSVAGAEQVSAAGIKLHGAASVCTGGIEGHELPIIQVYQNARITI